MADKKTRRSVVLVEQLLPIVVLATALIGAPMLIFSKEGLPRLRAVEKELQMVEQENAQFKRDTEALRGRVKCFRDDPVAIEQLARADLGLVRQSEVVFQLPVEK